MNNLELTKTFINIAKFLADHDCHSTDMSIKTPMGTLKCHFSFEIELSEDNNE